MHLIIDELLTKEQLTSPKKYIYQMCEMYGWEMPLIVSSSGQHYKICYVEPTSGKARKRQRLIHDACIRLGTRAVDNLIVEDNGKYICYALIPTYSNS